MGITISRMHSYYEFENGNALFEQPGQVLQLAERSIRPLLDTGLPENLSHIVVATTCPDILAPSLGQMLNEKFYDHFSCCHSIDIVQGCAGGVTALILGSQLAGLNRSSVLVVQADAAGKAASRSEEISRIFGNGSFACLIEYGDSDKRLIYTQSRQYKGLSEVVTVKLGHDSDVIIKRQAGDICIDPRKHLGLTMDNSLALKLCKKAEQFYLDFIENSEKPDIMILHQVNPVLLKHLEQVFAKYQLQFIDVVELTGNCGAASVGIALDISKHQLANKKIMLCSFGTGGVIIGGLWQN